MYILPLDRPSSHICALEKPTLVHRNCLVYPEQCDFIVLFWLKEKLKGLFTHPPLDPDLWLFFVWNTKGNAPESTITMNDD